MGGRGGDAAISHGGKLCVVAACACICRSGVHKPVQVLLPTYAVHVHTEYGKMCAHGPDHADETMDDDIMLKQAT